MKRVTLIILSLIMLLSYVSCKKSAQSVPSEPSVAVSTNEPSTQAEQMTEAFTETEPITEPITEAVSEAVDEATEPELEPITEIPSITHGQQWATITIESAQVYDIPVYHGGSESLSMTGVCHSMNSRFPGQGGRIVIYGHVGIYRFFQRLENMNVGDIVTISTIYGDYEYEVIRTEIHDQTDNSWTLPLEDESEDELVCYTCYPYNTSQVRTQRFAIICKKIYGAEWSEELL